MLKEPPQPRPRIGGRAHGRHLDPDSVLASAVRCLAEDEDIAHRFFAVTGLDGATIRAAVSEPGFLTIFLDFLSEDDRTFESFAARLGCDPMLLATFHAALKQGEERAAAQDGDGRNAGQRHAADGRIVRSVRSPARTKSP